MNPIIFRRSKKAVTPVIATIILIAATIVLALVVGAYTFGIFGSNTKAITATSVVLFSGSVTYSAAAACTAGTSTLQLSLTNPGSTTTISQIIVTGAGLTGVNEYTVTAPTTSGSAACTGVGTAASVTGASSSGSSSSFTLYVVSGTASQSLASGNTYNYVVNFANGQSVSGSTIAQ